MEEGKKYRGDGRVSLMMEEGRGKKEDGRGKREEG